MLVLSRKPGESVIIGGDIHVRILEVKGESVRLGIEAPKETTVHRREVYEAIIRENRAAAKVAKDIAVSLPREIV